MANQKVTDLGVIATAPNTGVMHFVDVTNTTQNAAGSSFKVTKADFLKEHTAAILLNTNKVSFDSGASARLANTSGTNTGDQDLTTYATLQSPTFTGTVGGITKSMVGLTNVDNTTDVDKPISTATQNALDLKETKPVQVTELKNFDINSLWGLGLINQTRTTPQGYSFIDTTFANYNVNPVLSFTNGFGYSVNALILDPKLGVSNELKICFASPTDIEVGSSFKVKIDIFSATASGINQAFGVRNSVGTVIGSVTTFNFVANVVNTIEIDCVATDANNVYFLIQTGSGIFNDKDFQIGRHEILKQITFLEVDPKKRLKELVFNGGENYLTDLSNETVTWTLKGTTPSFASPIVVDDNDNRFNYLFGKKIYPAYSAFPRNQGTGILSVRDYNETDGTFINANLFGIEFDFFGTQLDIKPYAPNTLTKIYLEVNGKLVNTNGYDNNVATNAANYININFSTRKKRTIRLYSDGFMVFYGVEHPKDGILSKTFKINTDTAVILGDSFTEGSNATKKIFQFSFLLNKILNITNLVSSGSGGTGYVNTGASRYKLFDRLDSDAKFPIGNDVKPLFRLIAMGVNDRSETLANVQAQARACFDKIRTYDSDVPLFVTGCFNSSTAQKTTTDPLSAIIKTQTELTANAYFIDVSNWTTGTGKVGATVGDGIADWLTDTDGTHPTDDGHAYLAFKLATAMKEIIKNF